MIEEKLNKEQLEAVNHKRGPLLIIAGAGTGKTKVITQRIAHIVEKKWAKPNEILALTFTEKAAAEMQERVDALLPLSYEEPFISTFHSFCDHILKQEAIYIGLDSNYKLMTPAESYILFRRHLFDFPLKKFRPLGNPSKFISSMISHFSRLSDEDVSYEEYLKYAKSLEREAKEDALELAKTYKAWNEKKVENSKLDFGDLISRTLELFRTRPLILQKYHELYKYILVDEYQDTNYSQNVLVNLLALGKENDREKANITVVGDDDQAIYKFRGAAISNILQFQKKYPNAKNVVLTTNYRSNQEILDTAYKLIKNNNPYRLEETVGIDKKLIAVKKERTDAVKLLVENRSQDESERIAKEIKSLVGKYKYSEIAILTRANNHADEIIDMLRYYKIPYKVGGAKSLYLRPEIQTLVSFLRTIADPHDDTSMFNILSMEEWRFEPKDVVNIIAKARREKIGTLEVINRWEDFSLRLSKGGQESIKKIIKIYERAIKMLVDGRSAGEILFMFFQASGLKEKYIKSEGTKYVFEVENTRKFFEMINAFWDNNRGTNLYEYLDYLKYSIEVGEGPVVDAEQLSDFDAVNILTVHSAKGLEFPVVFVANLVNDRFPSRDRSDTIPIPEKLIKEVLPLGGEYTEHIMEERRLCYVAFTRAKDLLYLSGANFYALAKRKKKPSMFLYEIFGKSIEEEFEKARKLEKEGIEDISVRAGKEALNYEKLGIKVRNKFSYSQLHAYEMCPIQYKYEYVLGLPTEQNGALSFGTTIHNTLKQVYENLVAYKKEFEGFNKVPTLSEALGLFEKNWTSVGYENKKHEKERYESGKRMFEEYFKNIFSKDENPLELERSFEYAIDDFLVNGRIDRVDLVGEENGKKLVEIIDYKTGKEKTKKDAQKEWQLQLYAFAIEQTTNYKVVKASYIFVEYGSKVEVDIQREKINSVLNHVREIVGKIRSGDFTPPPSHECVFCGFKDICDNAII